ncbi:MAG: exodeoxyribonuclease VII large subunit, partial [Atopostipes suicloacalis]|nr:exodeoxyribonuclease VII large subunit [Atopostipes suicloacalis]MDN6730914.1 exodeoxyribonuclease VII large subunit [Atopostipes suicloacalis]
LVQGLEHLSPLKIFSRGYSLVKKEEEIISSVEDLDLEDELKIKLSDGEVKATVKEIDKSEE